MLLLRHAAGDKIQLSSFSFHFYCPSSYIGGTVAALGRERNRSRLPGSPLPPLGSHRDRIKTSKTLLTRCIGTEACRRHALPFNGVKKPRGRRPRPHGTGRLTNARGRVGKLHGGCVDLHLRSVSVIVTAGRMFGRNELTAA